MYSNLSLPANLTLLNATPFPWLKVLNESTQMVNWDNVFPQQVDPGDIVVVPMSFSGSDSIAGDATVRYSLDDSTDGLFDFAFSATPEQDSPLTLSFMQSNASTKQPFTHMKMAWNTDTPAGQPFIVSSTTDPSTFSSMDMPTDWMHQNLGTLGCHSLRHLTLPGSHDSGMSILTSGTLLTTDDNTLTQWIDIGGQLNAGYRYFDLRPVIANGIFTAGHYSEILSQWVGGNGQPLSSMITELNTFTSQNKELIILDISHTFNTDDNWRALNPQEFTSLIAQLQTINHLYTTIPPNNDLSTLPLSTFISTSARVLILLPGAPTYPPGIFPPSALNIYNSYTDTPFPTLMRSDQLSKLAKQRTSPDSSMFLLSWTLTTIDNIRQLATLAHSMLFETASDGFWKTVVKTKASFPNVVLVDGIGAAGTGREVAALCLAVSRVVLEGVRCSA